jgi:ABC-type nitrate/sulfonate/bicarbonate transport system substrate-binding protein
MSRLPLTHTRSLRWNHRTRAMIAASSLLALLGGCANERAVEPVPSATSATGVCQSDGEVEDLGTLVIGHSTGTYTQPYVEWGIDQGCFAKYGLTIKNVAGQSQAARVAGLLGGSMDIIGQVPRFVVQSIANSEFDPLIISSHYEITAESLEAARSATQFDGEFLIDNSLILAPNSDVGSYLDLKGAIIATSSVNEATAVGLKRIAAQEGIDPDSFAFVELDQQESLNALLRGDVDAASLSPALALTAMEEGGRFLGYPAAQGFLPGSQVVWLTTPDLYAKNPEAYEAFRAAMWEIYGLLEKPANEEALRALIVDRFRVSEEVSVAIPFPDYTPRQVTLEELQVWVPELLARGDIDREVVLDESILLGP